MIRYFHAKLESVFSQGDQYTHVTNILEKIETPIADYIGLKTLISLIPGILSYVVLLVIGIDSPLFWAFLIFIPNFILTIGSLVTTIFPVINCLLQFGELMPGLLVLTFVGAIQVLVGNILEPRLMGNSLNISALVTIVSLSFWGSIWGITGMMLSIPVTVIIIIIFSPFQKTKPLAIMLSEKGKIEN